MRTRNPVYKTLLNRQVETLKKSLQNITTKSLYAYLTELPQLRLTLSLSIWKAVRKMNKETLQVTSIQEEDFS